MCLCARARVCVCARAQKTKSVKEQQGQTVTVTQTIDKQTARQHKLAFQMFGMTLNFVSGSDRSPDQALISACQIPCVVLRVV